MIRSTRLSLALALPFAFALSSCGDGLDLPANLRGPAGPTGTTATPTPAPTATPATPTPTPTPNAAGSCTLPSRPDCPSCCTDTRTGGLFNTAINNAQADLERTRPEIFNPSGSLRIDEVEYTTLLAAKLMAQNPGMCALGGAARESISKDEVAIKVSNDISQNVDVIIGSSHSPYIGGAHTCRPPNF